MTPEDPRHLGKKHGHLTSNDAGKLERIEFGAVTV
jgi:hypothetical protein